MLLLLRSITIILAIVMVLSLIVSLSLIIRSSIDKRLQPEKRKQKKKQAADLPSDAGIRALIAEGQVEDAVDLYRRFTGVDEFAAQSAIEDIQREIRLGQFDQDLHFILNDHGKAAAIQAYQAGTGSEFDEALAYIEKLGKAK